MYNEEFLDGRLAAGLLNCLHSLVAWPLHDRLDSLVAIMIIKTYTHFFISFRTLLSNFMYSR